MRRIAPSAWSLSASASDYLERSHISSQSADTHCMRCVFVVSFCFAALCSLSEHILVHSFCALASVFESTNRIRISLSCDPTTPSYHCLLWRPHTFGFPQYLFPAALKAIVLLSDSSHAASLPTSQNAIGASAWALIASVPPFTIYRQRRIEISFWRVRLRSSQFGSVIESHLVPSFRWPETVHAHSAYVAVALAGCIY